MLHKAWSSIEEVPYCFWRSSVKFQGHSAKKIVDFDLNYAFPDWKIDDLNPIWVRLLGRSQLSHPSDLPCSRSTDKFQGHVGQKNWRFWPELSVSGLQLQFEFTDGFEMMHKAWCSVEDLPYCFLRSPIKFQGLNSRSPIDLKWCTKLDLI